MSKIVVFKDVGGQAVLGRQQWAPTPWLTVRHGQGIIIAGGSGSCAPVEGGGEAMQLYAEKDIYDYPGFLTIQPYVLTEGMKEQIKSYHDEHIIRKVGKTADGVAIKDIPITKFRNTFFFIFSSLYKIL